MSRLICSTVIWWDCLVDHCLFCVIVLYVLTLTASDYHLGISKPLSCYNMTDVSCVFDNTCTYFNSFFKYIRTGDGVVFSPLTKKYFFHTIVFLSKSQIMFLVCWMSIYFLFNKIGFRIVFQKLIWSSPYRYYSVRSLPNSVF
jgi:hypothetical protein